MLCLTTVLRVLNPLLSQLLLPYLLRPIFSPYHRDLLPRAHSGPGIAASLSLSWKRSLDKLPGGDLGGPKIGWKLLVQGGQ